MEARIQEILAEAEIPPLLEYKDEFATMLTVQRQHEIVNCVIRQQTLDWMLSEHVFRNQESDIGRSAKSSRLRELGNKLFKAAPRKNALAACRLYTKAIFTAPMGNSLALAHANRAVALQEFGLFQQAYDDSECALELGYPENMRHKIWIRQAFCSRQLGDIECLKRHLDVLAEMPLNRQFTAQLEDLKQGLLELQENRDEEGVQNHRQTPDHGMTKIIKTKEKGRYMVATEFIPNNSIIFTEEFLSFVPNDDHQICQQCAATMFVPFPCYLCKGKVVYCSLKCRRAHQDVHVYECFAYGGNIFDNFGSFIRFALRVVVEHLPQASKYVRCTPSAKLIWRELTQEGGLVQRCNSPYARFLRTCTHMDKMPKADIFNLAVESQMLVHYLGGFTPFFDTLVPSSNVSRADWELITGSLILRHSGQLRCNSYSVQSMYRVPNGPDLLDFNILANNFWVSPWHVRCGFLHQFSFGEINLKAVSPHLSFCNHACDQAIQLKFSGRSIITLASKSLNPGDEISRDHIRNSKKLKREHRLQFLKEVYHFECKCSLCTKEPEPDEDYNKFHQCRCDQSNCRKIFISQSRLDVHWWLSKQPVYNIDNIKCSHCNKMQRLNERHTEFIDFLRHTNNTAQRKKLLQFYDTISEFLVGFNILKINYAYNIVLRCYSAYSAGSHLNNAEFLKLINLSKFCLRGLAEQDGFTLEYVARMTILWDLIALGKYKPTQEEATEMMQAIEIASDEMQQILRNYYHDYIAPKLED